MSGISFLKIDQEHVFDLLPFSLFFAALLLAYMKGNGNLCRAIVRSGATLGVRNKEGLSIFNAPVATKQLLFKLLGEYKILPFLS